MEKLELVKNNNSKKLIIGISILFCAVILIIGVTTAFFTQSDSEDISNIVTTNINGTIGYTDNYEYMRNNLIPVKEEYVDDFAMKNSLNGYTNNDICHYQDDLYACSLYQFTIVNNADVTQEMNVTLNPNPNQYSNLYYIMYEEEQESLTTTSKVAKISTHIDGNNSSTMVNNVILKPEESKTYTVVFYILSLDLDQTLEDSGKSFGAIIRVDSVTTGAYTSNTVGETCYEMEEIVEGDYAGTYKLTKFNGIKDDGSIIKGCGVTQDNDGFYSVIIPSKIGENEISTLGNRLFTAYKLELNEDIEYPIVTFNNYSKINNIVILEGIKNIEDNVINSDFDTLFGAFAGIGLEKIDFSQEETDAISFATNLDVSFPSTLINIGDNSFFLSSLTKFYINKNQDGESSLKRIGSSVFYNNLKLTSLELPYGIELIGEAAFSDCNIISDINNPLIIPASVQTLEEGVFDGNDNLTRVVFEDTENNPSQLKSVNGEPFFMCNLTYLTKEDPLIIPSNVEYIANRSFASLLSIDTNNPNLKFIKYTGEHLSKFDTFWYYNITLITD